MDEKLNKFAGLVTDLTHYIDGAYFARDQGLLSTIRNTMALTAQGNIDKAILLLKQRKSSINL
jgi:hypothetical protein